VVDGVTGLRVDGESLDAVQHAIARVLQDPAKANEMGRQARERVRANFTHERRVAELCEMVGDDA
jgi:glycosyltransferase involved in cell wall biosynthesis